jgi:hypothetical protein
MNRSTRIGIGLVVLLGAFVFFMLTVGSLGEPQPNVEQMSVARVLSAEGSPVDRYGNRELRIFGWYAELAADCSGTRDGAGEAAWLERTCPIRVLMPYQPAENVTQAELEANGLRLAAPNGRPFPSRAEPSGPNLRLQQLVYVGHFDDAAAAGCADSLRDSCLNTFVVSDYIGFLR